MPRAVGILDACPGIALCCCSKSTDRPHLSRLVSRMALANADRAGGSREPSYVQYAAHDLATYLGQLGGTTIPVVSTVRTRNRTGTRIAIGRAAARSLGVDLGSLDDLKDDGFVIRSFDQKGGPVVAVAGRDPHGTNTGVASLICG